VVGRTKEDVMNLTDIPAYCINLADRADRWSEVQDELSKFGWGLPVERIEAVKATPGWVGCAESHFIALRRGNTAGKPFCVLEDDVLFLQDRQVLLDAIDQLPDDWDMLYLGASPKKPQERYSDNLFRLDNAHVTHAIMWNTRKGGALDYVLNDRAAIRKIDDYFATVIQPMFNCFVTYPMVATQKHTQSDTCKRSDVSTILRNYNTFCK